MKTCDVCKKPLGVFHKFRYADGYICKECYKKASSHFAETIVKKNLSEIRQLCSEYETTQTEEFQITGKIGNFLLVDEIGGKICLPNNRIIKKETALPTFYNIEDIEGCEIWTDPKQSLEQLEENVEKRQEGTVQSLKVVIYIRDMAQPVEILLIGNKVRMKSYAFRQSFRFARKIEEEICRLRDQETESERQRR